VDCIRLFIRKKLYFNSKSAYCSTMKGGTNLLVIAVLFVTNFATIDGIALDCTYGSLSFGSTGSIYTCTARALSDGNENVTTVYGIHLTGKGYDDVHGFYVESQNLEFFPTNIENFFPNLIAINFHNNSITGINNRHLIPFPNMQYIGLWRNKITSIDGDLFSGLDSMKLIDFGSNNLRHVGHDLNLPMDGLIYFDANPCINQVAFTPDEVPALKLNLLRNCPPTISQIEDSLERRQNLLTHIDGQVQALRHEQADLLERMAYVESIIGNQLEARPVGQLLIEAFRKDD